MRKQRQVIILSVLVLLAVSAGCTEQKPMGQEAGGLARTDTPIQDVKTLPKWVAQRGAAFSGEKRVFYGAGNASGLQNPSLRRKSAEGQARRDIAQTMQTYVAALQKQYLAETTAGDMSKQSVEQHITDTMKQVTEATLVGSQIVEYWENPLRNESYALARLDLEQFLDVMKSYQSAVGNGKELDAKVREYVRKNAEKAHDELNAELGKKGQSSAQ
ncbi:MAG: LPP20 family lipoprotein [Nitrospirae bacterium]|nr:LPP20 family lipoprotein [Nitrospirota bacterium]